MIATLSRQVLKEWQLQNLAAKLSIKIHLTKHNSGYSFKLTEIGNPLQWLCHRPFCPQMREWREPEKPTPLLLA